MKCNSNALSLEEELNVLIDTLGPQGMLSLQWMAILTRLTGLGLTRIVLLPLQATAIKKILLRMEPLMRMISAGQIKVLS